MYAVLSRSVAWCRGWCLRGRVLSDTGGQWLRVTSAAPPPPHPRAARPRPAPPRLTAGMQLSLFLSWVSILPRPRHGPQPRDHWPMGCERTEAGCRVCLTLALASRTPRPASLDAGAAGGRNQLYCLLITGDSGANISRIW